MSRNIGTLMQTEEAGGQSRFWMKLNAEILSPALFTLVMRATAKKGDDRVTAAVFAPRDDNAPTSREPYAEGTDID